MVDPRPFSEQNTGLTNQTGNRLAIHVDQFGRSLVQHTLVLYCNSYSPRMADQYFKWLIKFHICGHCVLAI